MCSSAGPGSAGQEPITMPCTQNPWSRIARTVRVLWLRVPRLARADDPLDGQAGLADMAGDVE